MNISKAKSRLGYTQEWIEFGIISEELVNRQYQEILRAEDQNAGHYRWGAFVCYLNSKSALTDLEVDRIFRLNDKGPDDEDLSNNRIYKLIESGILTEEQFEKIKNRPELRNKALERLYQRTKIKKEIVNNGLATTFLSVIESEDSSIHEFALGRPEINLEQILWFKENGGNKRVRNLSKQMANNKMYRNRV